MAFGSFEEFLAMGNHGFYVWFAYGLTFVIMAGLAFHSVSAHNQTRRDLRAQRRRTQAINADDKQRLNNNLEAPL